MTLTNGTESAVVQRIGFGCSRITAGFEARSNVRLLRLVYDHGVRHFDTAPLYGHGTSEDVIGTAFRSDRHDIVIATKVGIPHGNLSYRKQIFRLAASPVRRWAPGLSASAARRIYSGPLGTDFSTPSIQRSLEKSLKKLKTDYVDILLLHEVQLEDMTDELLRELQNLVQHGKVRKIGIGTGIESIREISAAGWAFDVYQRPWSVLVPDEDLLSDRYQVFHSAILGAMATVTERLNADAVALNRIQKGCGLERLRSEEIAKLLLLGAVSANPHGTVLFSSRISSRAVSYLNFLQRATVAQGADFVKVIRGLN